MCLITLTFYQGNLTVLAMDAEAVRGHEEIRALLIKHVNAVLRTYPNAQVALAVENNLGNEASHMREMMRKHQRVKCLYEHAGLAGVRTTAARDAGGRAGHGRQHGASHGPHSTSNS